MYLEVLQVYPSGSADTGEDEAKIVAQLSTDPGVPLDFAFAGATKQNSTSPKIRRRWLLDDSAVKDANPGEDHLYQKSDW